MNKGIHAAITIHMPGADTCLIIILRLRTGSGRSGGVSVTDELYHSSLKCSRIQIHLQKKYTTARGREVRGSGFTCEMNP